MTLSLSHIQNQFAKALRYQDKGENCNIVSDHLSADERIQIYRNNFIISLSEVLSATYPMVKELVGDTCFDGLAHSHILNYLPTSGDVNLYGKHFDQTIRHTSIVIDSVPYLADVANFEWLYDLSTQDTSSTDATCRPMPLELLVDINESDQEDIFLCVQPNLQLFQSEFAIFSLHKAIHTNSFHQLNLTEPEQGVIYSIGDRHISAHPLSVVEFKLLTELTKSKTLKEIEPNLLIGLDKLITLNLCTGFGIKS